MPGRKLRSALLIACVLVQGCAFFTNKKPATTSGNKIKVGLVGSFSGSNAGNGDIVLNAVNMALARINPVGVLGGQQFEVLRGDDRSDPDESVKVAKDLIAQGAVALIGPNSSGIAKKMVLDAAKPAGVSVISPSATSPDFSDPAKIDSGGFFFRTVPSDALQGKVLARKALEAKYTKLAVIHVDNPYGNGLTDVLRKTFDATAGNSSIDIKYPELSEASEQAAYDYGKVVQQALDFNPSAVVLVSYPGDGSTVINTWGRSGKMGNLPWMFTDATFRQEFPDNITNKTSVEGKIGTAPYTDPKFIELFTNQFKADPGFDGGAAYDAMCLVALAIETGKASTKEAVKANLRAVSGPGSNVITPDTIATGLADVRAGKAVNYDGWAGPVDLDEHGDVTSGKYVIWKITNGKVGATSEVLSP